jgi:hypothetical protein
MNVTGKVIVLKDVETRGERFRKREVVIETQEGRYPQELQIEYQNDRISLLDGVSVGDVITCWIDLRGRGWVPPNGGEKRWFVSLVGWRIDKGAAPAEVPPVGQDGTSAPQPATTSADTVDEIPF